MVKSRNLALIEKQKLFEFLNSFDDVLCDCDGVVFTSFKPIEGAFTSLNKLKQLGKTVRFVSNNCTQTLENLVSKIRDGGFKIERKDIILPTLAIISYLKSINFKKKVFVIGVSNLKKEFVDAGFKLADSGPHCVKETTESLLAEVQDNLDVGAVVFDWDLNLNYIQLQKTLIYLKRPEVLFIAASLSKQVPFDNGISLLGTGYFQDIITNISGRKPIVFGKPSKLLNTYISECFNLKPERTLLIGDLFSDMNFAANVGYQTLMILTENIKESDVLHNGNNGNVNDLPMYYLNSLGELYILIDFEENRNK